MNKIKKIPTLDLLIVGRVISDYELYYKDRFMCLKVEFWVNSIKCFWKMDYVDNFMLDRDFYLPQLIQCIGEQYTKTLAEYIKRLKGIDYEPVKLSPYDKESLLEKNQDLIYMKVGVPEELLKPIGVIRND